LKIRRADVYRYSLPLESPLQLRGQRLETRDGLLLRLEAENGAHGWGDCAPLPGFSGETFEQAQDVLLRCARRLLHMEIPADYSYFEGAEIARSDDYASVGFAVESAWFGMLAESGRVPLHRYLNPAATDHLRVNALLAGPEEVLLARADAVREAGYTAAKIKVGGDPIASASLCHKVRELLPAPIILRADANRAWNMEEAEAFARAVAACQLDYIEEPLHDPFRLPEFFDNTGVPYAVDETLHEFHVEIKSTFDRESVKTPAFAEHVRKLLAVFHHAHAVVWKPSLIYLPNMGSDILHGRFALPVNRLVLSAAFESGVGIGTLAHFAAAYCRHGEPVGLDTYAWLREDTLQERLPLEAGEIDMLQIGGLSSGVDMDRLELVPQ
jgi:O-succinylbenzoate synthase